VDGAAGATSRGQSRLIHTRLPHKRNEGAEAPSRDLSLSLVSVTARPRATLAGAGVRRGSARGRSAAAPETGQFVAIELLGGGIASAHLRATLAESHPYRPLLVHLLRRHRHRAASLGSGSWRGRGRRRGGRLGGSRTLGKCWDGDRKSRSD